MIGKEVKLRSALCLKAIFGEIEESGLSGMLHYKELSYDENVEDLKRYKKNDKLNVKILEVKDEKIRFSKEL